jgi:uncharacterized membrane protein required for colicin V production
MNLLIGLLCIAVFLGIAFWLLGLIIGGIPRAPGWARGAILGVLALFALVWFLGGYSPFYGPNARLDDWPAHHRR